MTEVKGFSGLEEELIRMDTLGDTVEIQAGFQQQMDGWLQQIRQSFPPKATATVSQLLRVVRSMKPLAESIRGNSDDARIAGRYIGREGYEARLEQRWNAAIRAAAQGGPAAATVKPEPWLYDQIRRDTLLVFSRAVNVRTQAVADAARAVVLLARDIVVEAAGVAGRVGESIVGAAQGAASITEFAIKALRYLPWIALAGGGIWAYTWVRRTGFLRRPTDRREG